MEYNETFRATLSLPIPSNLFSITPSSAIVTIVDDDSKHSSYPPSLLPIPSPPPNSTFTRLLHYPNSGQLWIQRDLLRCVRNRQDRSDSDFRYVWSVGKACSAPICYPSRISHWYVHHTTPPLRLNCNSLTALFFNLNLAGIDYDSVTSTVTFDPTHTSQYVNVPITNKGVYQSSSKSFDITLTLTDPIPNGFTVDPDTATVTIEDNHSEAAFSPL